MIICQRDKNIQAYKNGNEKKIRYEVKTTKTKNNTQTQTHRHTDTQTQTHRHTQTQTDRQERQTDRQTDRVRAERKGGERGRKDRGWREFEGTQEGILKGNRENVRLLLITGVICNNCFYYPLYRQMCLTTQCICCCCCCTSSSSSSSFGLYSVFCIL